MMFSIRNLVFRSARSTQRPGFIVKPKARRASKENPFLRERKELKEHAAKNADFWRKMALYVSIPALTVAGFNAWKLWNQHWAHQATLPPDTKRVEYSYQNIRAKNYFWGDGDKKDM
ncbi:cytochrome c oxidase-like protein [Kalaharituber pfeilii]|nr:cytochrome c oxidase-like protein [Kalaharituber pfeilii]